MADPTPAPTAAAHPSHPQRLRRAQPVPPADLRAALSVIDNDLARIEARASRGTKALGADGREVPEEEAMMGGEGGAKQFQSQPSQSQSQSQSSVTGAGAGAVVEVDLTPAERTELEARAEAGRSLRRNLERMCRPASDGEGGEGGGRFAAEERMERIRRDMDPDADDDDDDADSSGDEDAADEGAAIDDDDPDRSFEETQLVDQDALRRARELRGRVRDLASRIRRGREGTTRRASELVGREVEAMRLAVGAGGGGMGDVDDADAEDDAGAAAAMAMAQVEEVREALRSLEVAARGLEGGGRTGEALADLAATAEAVQGALERGGGAGAGAGAAAKLSQTERAILAKPEREGAGGTMHAAEDPEARARIGAMDPADRLAAFLDGGAAPSVV